MGEKKGRAGNPMPTNLGCQQPNASFADRFEYDMSRIRLRADGPDFKILRVSRVVENSPATEAGVREGDVVSAIDGRPTVQMLT